MKMKRKEGGVDEVSDDFSEFSLSSPARKIRRLDHTLPHLLPPIMEEEDDAPSHPRSPYYNDSHNQQDHHPPAAGSDSVIIEELPSDFDSDTHPPLPSFHPDHTFSNNDPDQDRAIVLFKPVPTPPVYSPSCFSLVSVDSHILSGIKNSRFPWSSKSGSSQENDGQTQEEKNNGECLAVVPWVPSSLVSASASAPTPVPVASHESMEADEMDVDFQDRYTPAMDTATATEQRIGIATVNAAPPSQGMFPQWQQHCMIPQIPPNSSAPITWSQ